VRDLSFREDGRHVVANRGRAEHQPQRTYELKDGARRTVLEVEADDVAASLKFASAKLSKATRSRTESGGKQPSGGGESDPRASEGSGGYSDSPPS
jgi:single-strand DNA-binding protein